MSFSYTGNDNEKIYVRSNYVQKDYKELFINLLEEAHDEGLISHNELFVDYVKSKQDISSYYVMTLSIIADSEEDIYYDMSDVYLSNKVNHALGTDLDDMGIQIGCPRPSATFAGVELTFQLQATYDTSITLPEGILVSTDEGIIYQTLEKVTIPKGERTATVYAESIEAGVDYRVPADSLNRLQSTIELIDGEIVGLEVTNLMSSTGGREAYNDNEYRELILDWIKNNTRGSKEAYTRYFATVDGLDGYKLIPNWNGSGTLKIVLDPGYPYQLKEVYDDIIETVCQFPDDITMFSPERVGIDIYARCNVDIDEINPYSATEKAVIKSKIEDAIKLYIEGDLKEERGLGIGQDFIPYKLGVFISKKVPELKNITFEYPKEPVTIMDEELAVCNGINIEME